MALLIWIEKKNDAMKAEQEEMKRMLLQMDILGGMLFGKDYNVSLLGNYENTTSPANRNVYATEEGREKQDMMLNQLRGLGIKVKEV